ncbi:MAG TPA: tetratricopeptide repeat protein [Bacteroidota bacterium]|nr:tetratricopeptide repeat protein [Bacteroidota bacterium]
MITVGSFTLKDRQGAILAALLVAAVTFVVYSGSFKNDFIGWDDEYYVLANPYITPLSLPMIGRMFSNFHFKSWTPLTLLSHAVDYKLWRLDPRGHHLTNLLLHTLNAVCVFFLSLVVFRRYKWRSSALSEQADGAPSGPSEEVLLLGALASSLFFAFHPLRVEAVECVSSRKDLLSTAFVLAATLLYFSYASRRGNAGSWKPYTGSLVLYVLALLSKGSVMTFAGILLILDLLIEGPSASLRQWMRLLAEKIPFLLLGLACAVVAYLASGTETSMAQILRTQSEFPRGELGQYNIAFYVLKTLWPEKLAELYTYPLIGRFTVIWLITPALTLAFIILWWRGFRSWLFAWAFYIVALLPMAGFVPSSIQIIANRYVYFAGASFALLFGGGVLALGSSGFLRRRRFGMPAASIVYGCILAALAVRTINHIGDWRDAETVWRHTISVSPGHALAHNELGLTLMENGQYAEAIESFARAIQIYPQFSEAMCNMGGTYVSMGDTVSAERMLRAAIKLSPRDYASFTNLGNVRMVEHRYADAEEFYRQALVLNPTAAIATYNLGYAQMFLGKTDEAITSLTRAVQLNPNYAAAHYLLAEIFSRLPDRRAESLSSYRRAARLGNTASQRVLAAQGLDW